MRFGGNTEGGEAVAAVVTTGEDAIADAAAAAAAAAMAAVEVEEFDRLNDIVPVHFLSIWREGAQVNPDPRP